MMGLRHVAPFTSPCIYYTIRPPEHDMVQGYYTKVPCRAYGNSGLLQCVQVVVMKGRRGCRDRHDEQVACAPGSDRAAMVAFRPMPPAHHGGGRNRRRMRHRRSDRCAVVAYGEAGATHATLATAGLIDTAFGCADLIAIFTGGRFAPRMPADMNSENAHALYGSAGQDVLPAFRHRASTYASGRPRWHAFDRSRHALHERDISCRKMPAICLTALGNHAMLKRTVAVAPGAYP